MDKYYYDYLEKIHFKSWLKKLKKRLKNKKVIIYGVGVLFKHINDNYDLSDINIIGVSDMKFSAEQEGQDFLQYKIIPKTEIVKYKPDYVLFATEKYLGLMESMERNMFKNTKIKLLPLAKISMWEVIKTIWIEV